jgi:hypothetical protein
MSDNDIIVIAHATRRQGLVNQLESRLADARIPFSLEAITDPIPNVAAGNLEYNIRGWRKTIAKYHHFKKIVMVDAWDMLFVGSKAGLIEVIPEDGVLVGTERGSWPDPYLEPLIDHTTRTGVPWHCCNWGSFAGTPDSFTNWFIEIEQHPWYMPKLIAQQWANILLAHHGMSGPLRLLDYQTRLCYSTQQDKGELQFADTDHGYRPYNTITCEFPQFIHFNHVDPSGFLMLEFAVKCQQGVPQ